MYFLSQPSRQNGVTETDVEVTSSDRAVRDFMHEQRPVSVTQPLEAKSQNSQISHTLEQIVDQLDVLTQVGLESCRIKSAPRVLFKYRMVGNVSKSIKV